MSETLYYTTHESRIGTILMVGSARGLRYLTLLGKGADAVEHLTTQYGQVPSPIWVELGGFFATTAAAVDLYLAGDGPLELPVDLAGGTALQRSVWLEIARIPYGETISYTVLAERVGFPRAVRAVASACGANPLPLVIPCHRVVAKDGSLGGFSLGGLDVKEVLLALERGEQRAVA